MTLNDLESRDARDQSFRHLSVITLVPYLRSPSIGSGQFGAGLKTHLFTQAYTESSETFCWRAYSFALHYITLLIERLKFSVKEPNKFHNYETQKITRKASDAAEYIELFGSSTPRSSCTTTHLMLFSERPLICVVHDDLRWQNWTTHCNRFWRAGCSRLEYVDIRLVY